MSHMVFKTPYIKDAKSDFDHYLNVGALLSSAIQDLKIAKPELSIALGNEIVNSKNPRVSINEEKVYLAKIGKCISILKDVVHDLHAQIKDIPDYDTPIIL